MTPPSIRWAGTRKTWIAKAATKAPITIITVLTASWYKDLDLIVVTAIKYTGETGLEPATSCVTGKCSNRLNYSPTMGNGHSRTRTYDHLLVRQALYQLSYVPPFGM